MNARRQRGLTLVELMIAMTIGLFLMAGAVQVYVVSRNTFDVYQTSARLEETARYAMSIIEPDVRMANYYGFQKGQVGFTGAASQTAAVAAALAGASATTCGNNFSVDLNTFLEGRNDAYALGCGPFAGGAVTSADTLTVRRAATTPSAVPAGTTGPLRVCVTGSASTPIQLVNNAGACVAAPNGTVADLVVDSYYVAQNSTQAAGVPALRQWSLTPTPDFVDNEIISGVEDLQVQFGIETQPTAAQFTGVVQQYVDTFGPATVLPAVTQIVAIRIWLLVRSDSIETGFVDGNVYQYANRKLANGTTTNLSAAGSAGKAYAPGDNFRRLLVSRTIKLRNAAGV
jgi:type IV pilus assembly protein PilW